VIIRAIRDSFDLRPAAIIRDLDLLRPIYRETATYGHFGRDLPNFTWERLDKVDELRRKAGL
jgi:S-adenosylmethionine synthetase